MSVVFTKLALVYVITSQNLQPTFHSACIRVSPSRGNSHLLLLFSESHEQVHNALDLEDGVYYYFTTPLPPTPVELRLLRAVKSNAAKHLLATFPMMLNVSLEEDLGMFSTLSLCVLLQAL